MVRLTDTIQLMQKGGSEVKIKRRVSLIFFIVDR